MRLIDADALYNRYLVNMNGQRIPERDCDNFPVTVSIRDVKKNIKDAPTIDAEPKIHSAWTKKPDLHSQDPYEQHWDYYCGNCNRFMGWPGNYCPNCGAKMDA